MSYNVTQCIVCKKVKNLCEVEVQFVNEFEHIRICVDCQLTKFYTDCFHVVCINCGHIRYKKFDELIRKYEEQNNAKAMMNAAIMKDVAEKNLWVSVLPTWYCKKCEPEKVKEIADNYNRQQNWKYWGIW